MAKTTELTTDLEGRLVRSARIEYSLVESAQSAGRVRAWNGKAMAKNRQQLAKHLMVRDFWISTEVWNAYTKAYEENVK